MGTLKKIKTEDLKVGDIIFDFDSTHYSTKFEVVKIDYADNELVLKQLCNTQSCYEKNSDGTITFSIYTSFNNFFYI
jgi:hypothetical protein